MRIEIAFLLMCNLKYRNNSKLEFFQEELDQIWVLQQIRIFFTISGVQSLLSKDRKH